MNENELRRQILSQRELNHVVEEGMPVLLDYSRTLEESSHRAREYMMLLQDVLSLEERVAESKVKAQIKNNTTNVVSTGVDRNTVAPTTVTKTDQGVRVQATADADTYIPVVYGEAFTQGKLTDVEMTTDGTTMWYCLTLSEFTGNHIDGTPSTIDFENIYWNNSRVTFRSDGFTVEKTTDVNGIDDRSIADLVEIHCYSNGSANPVGITGQAAPANTPAYNRMPSWTSTDAMSGLVFILVKVFYNPARNLTGLPPVTAQLKNSLTLPGDVLYDYMINTRYGAGIPAAEVNVS